MGFYDRARDGKPQSHIRRTSFASGGVAAVKAVEQFLLLIDWNWFARIFHRDVCGFVTGADSYPNSFSVRRKT